MEEAEQLSPEADFIYKKLGQQRYERLAKDMQLIAARFKERVGRYEGVVKQPLTPSTEAFKKLDEEVEELHQAKKFIMDDFSEVDPFAGMTLSQYIWRKYFLLPDAIHPQSKLMIAMVFLQTCALLYNAWAIPLRFSFQLYHNENTAFYWALADYTCDGIYIFDMVVIRSRLQYLDASGIYEKKRKLTIINYIKEGTFKKDLASLLPLDLLYLSTGFTGLASILRFPRLLRFYHFGDLFERLDSAFPFPMLIRLSRTVNIMLYLIHLTACAYYAFSYYQGIGSSGFVYDGEGNAYAVCFYVGLKTAVSIGKNPKPGKDNVSEMLFMGVLWLMGVFVFAVLIGNVKEIIAQATAAQDEYMFNFDQLSQYMYRLNVPEDTVKRVKQWCQHTWKTQKSFDELAILEFLPSKMRTDVALDVHYKTICGVKLFHGCDPGLLKSLVVRLRPILFLPGDYICRKGDVGKEMFIITTGAVQVVGGPDDSIVFVTLKEGICFGEIALLGKGKMNRRTANVRAHGFTTLYVLYKEDLVDALRDYPEDRALLARKAQKAAKEVAAKQAANAPVISKTTQDVIVPWRKEPVMVTTLLKLVPKDSNITKWLSPSSLSEKAANDDELLIVEKHQENEWKSNEINGVEIQ